MLKGTLTNQTIMPESAKRALEAEAEE